MQRGGGKKENTAWLLEQPQPGYGVLLRAECSAHRSAMGSGAMSAQCSPTGHRAEPTGPNMRNKGEKKK